MLKRSLRLAVLSSALLCACQTPAPVLESPCADAIEIDDREAGRSVEVFAANACHVPVFVELSFTKLNNLAPSRPLPVRVSVPPRSRRDLLKLEQIDRSLGWSYAWSTSLYFGTSAPQPDTDHRYAFPFGGSQPRRLIQGVDGALTHHGLHRYAFDFDMPIGTPVLAAREGIVLSVHDGFGEGRFAEKYKLRDNKVILLHPDGTTGLYGHLSAGIFVREGASVAAGEVLGLSGNSGYSRGPHLHFEVDAQRKGAESESIPIRFRGEVVPVVGGLYGPQRGASQAGVAAGAP